MTRSRPPTTPTPPPASPPAAPTSSSEANTDHPEDPATPDAVTVAWRRLVARLIAEMDAAWSQCQHTAPRQAPDAEDSTRPRPATGEQAGCPKIADQRLASGPAPPTLRVVCPAEPPELSPDAAATLLALLHQVARKRQPRNPPRAD